MTKVIDENGGGEKEGRRGEGEGTIQRVTADCGPEGRSEDFLPLLSGLELVIEVQPFVCERALLGERVRVKGVREGVNAEVVRGRLEQSEAEAQRQTPGAD